MQGRVHAARDRSPALMLLLPRGITEIIGADPPLGGPGTRAWKYASDRQENRGGRFSSMAMAASAKSAEASSSVWPLFSRASASSSRPSVVA